MHWKGSNQSRILAGYGLPLKSDVPGCSYSVPYYHRGIEVRVWSNSHWPQWSSTPGVQFLGRASRAQNILGNPLPRGHAWILLDSKGISPNPWSSEARLPVLQLPSPASRGPFSPPAQPLSLLAPCTHRSLSTQGSGNVAEEVPAFWPGSPSLLGVLLQSRADLGLRL